MLRRFFLPVSVALVAAVIAAPGAPVHADPLAVVAGETLDVKADQLDVDVGAGTALLEGNVRASLGDLDVSCPKVEIRYDEAPRVKWVRGSGGVRASLKGIVARASSVELLVSERRAVLKGGVRLTRDKGWVEAESAEIHLDTRKVTLRGVKGSIPVETPER